MYPLLPWNWLKPLLMVVVTVAVVADDLGRWAGIEISDSILIRMLPVILLVLFSGFFGFTCYWAPWRILWRCCPQLNDWFPDLNGIWVGRTSSNWPTIKKLVDSAQSYKQITENELYDVPEQLDAIAMKITNSLFSLRIRARLSSTDGESYSITAKPWRHQHTDRVHLSYVYQQETPNPTATDKAAHIGAADIVLMTEECPKLEGIYWTSRNWKTGCNTAGTLMLIRLMPDEMDQKKTLRDYASNHT